MIKRKKHKTESTGYPRYTPEQYFNSFLYSQMLSWQRCLEWNGDLQQIDTHGFPIRFDETGTLWINTPAVEVWIEKRNSYCNRGRFGLVVNATDRTNFDISEGQLFPRYFFSLQRLFDELDDWFTFNELPRRDDDAEPADPLESET